jgi:predicted negative regulator of RcsB-dependent stress response
MHWGDWLSIVGVLGTVIAIGTLLGVALRVGRNTQTVNNYRESAQAWEAKARVQEDTIESQKKQISDLQHQVGELTGKLAVLSELVTGKAVLEELARDVQEAVQSIKVSVLDRETFEAWKEELRGDVTKILREVESNE